MSAPTTQVPARLQRALESQQDWGRAGVHLVPIRHHSPACALALSALLEEVRPTAVLIEGPAEYTPLLPALQDPATVPPIAVLSLTGRTASYYPLAEFSPEWVALRWAGEHAAEVRVPERGEPGESLLLVGPQHRVQPVRDRDPRLVGTEVRQGLYAFPPAP